MHAFSLQRQVNQAAIMGCKTQVITQVMNVELLASDLN